MMEPSEKCRVHVTISSSLKKNYKYNAFNAKNREPRNSQIDDVGKRKQTQNHKITSRQFASRYY